MNLTLPTSVTQFWVWHCKSKTPLGGWDGRREVLGMYIGTSEAKTFRAAFLHKLARRDLRSVKLVVSDAHEGIKAAVSAVSEENRLVPEA